MGKKDKNHKIPGSAASRNDQQTLKYLTSFEISAHSLGEDQGEYPYVSLKYFQTSFECFSDWAQNELKDFSGFINSMSGSNWTQIFQSGGKERGKKKGLAMTYLPNNKYPDSPALREISSDITFFELRVSGESRVHGFRSHSAFFLVYLDRQHRICP